MPHSSGKSDHPPGGHVAPPLAGAAPKPYLSAGELSRLTPWTTEAIDAMVKRGVFREREHWFRIPGRRERIFKWQSVVDLIEGRTEDRMRKEPRTTADIIPMLNGSKLRVPS